LVFHRSAQHGGTTAVFDLLDFAKHSPDMLSPRAFDSFLPNISCSLQSICPHFHQLF
jgi:hypothetical protein